MSILGWILAGVLAAFFFAAGAAKQTSSREKLLTNPNMSWAADFTAPQIKVISALEVLGAIGVVLPGLLNIAPALTPVAATGCALVMVGAAVPHIRRHDPKALPPKIVAFVLAITVAVIRFSQL